MASLNGRSRDTVRGNEKDTESLKTIFVDIMNLTSVPQNFLDLKMSDIEEWDSLANMNVLMELENAYNIRFTIDEMTELNSITNIMSTIYKKTKKL